MDIRDKDELLIRVRVNDGHPMETDEVKVDTHVGIIPIKRSSIHSVLPRPLSVGSRVSFATGGMACEGWVIALSDDSYAWVKWVSNGQTIERLEDLKVVS